MIDHNKIEDAIDNYFTNTPTAKIIENLDRHRIERKENLDRTTVNNKESVIGKLVRFEEVSPANQDAAFIAVSIESLVVPLGLPIYDGYDGLDELQLTFLTLPSGETVTLAMYLNSPQPGTSIYVDSAMQNIPQVVFESCQQLQVSREEVLWFHPDWQEEIDSLFETLRERLYAEYGSIEKRLESLQLEELTQLQQYEPIDCFNHALRIYTREYVPATYWAMLQHNLGLAYFNRVQGDRRENLERSIECFNKSLEIYTQNKFPEKWGINQEDLVKSQRLIKQILVKDILDRPIPYRRLSYTDLRGTNLNGADLRSADLRGASLDFANLDGTNFGSVILTNRQLLTDIKNRISKPIIASKFSGLMPTRSTSLRSTKGANLSEANLSNSSLRGANLRGANLKDTNLRGADVRGAKFGNNLGISKSMQQDLIDRGAIFDDAPQGDRSESRNLVPR
jgi:tetratricopeptide (TPR) repeat protein